MPRPKKPKGSMVLTVNPFRLTEPQKARLICDILGIDMEDKNEEIKADHVRINIENWIGAYFKYLENPTPTKAAVIGEISSVRQNSIKLIKEVTGLSGWASDRLEKLGYDEYDLTHALAKFCDITAKIIGEKQEESRGQPPKVALQILVNHLRFQFEKSYCSLEDYADDDPNGTKAKIARNQSLNNFVIECLRFARIEHPRDISSLFYTDKTPDSERLFFNQIP
jgi:hypothetical protein